MAAENYDDFLSQLQDEHLMEAAISLGQVKDANSLFEEDDDNDSDNDSDDYSQETSEEDVDPDTYDKNEVFPSSLFAQLAEEDSNPEDKDADNDDSDLPSDSDDDEKKDESDMADLGVSPTAVAGVVDFGDEWDDLLCDESDDSDDDDDDSDKDKKSDDDEKSEDDDDDSDADADDSGDDE